MASSVVAVSVPQLREGHARCPPRQVTRGPEERTAGEMYLEVSVESTCSQSFS